MKTLSTTTALRILLLLAAIFPFTKASAHDFEVGKLQYSITSVSTVKVTGTNSNVYSIEIPNHVTFNNIEYTVTAIGDSAFYNTYITDAIIPETINSIGVAAFKNHYLENITIKALTPPIMHDSFDQHEKPTSVIIDETDGSQNVLVLSVYKEAYSHYKILNDQHHFFSLISCIDGEATEAPYFEEDFEYSAGNDEPYSCTITIHGEEDSYIFVRYNNNDDVWLDDNVFSCTCYNYCMYTENYLEARAILEGNSPSTVAETSVYLYPRWYESFDFEDSNLCFNIVSQNEVDVTHCTYYNPCTGEEDYDDDYNTTHYYYSGDVVIPKTVNYNNKTYNVTTIGEKAFKNCSGLTSITIPNSIKHINDGAFKNCTGLSRVNITDLAAWCHFDFIDYSEEYSSLNPLYYAHHLYLNDSEVTDLIIPNTVKYISIYAFINCSGLTSVTIPNSVTEIGGWSFEDCTSLTSVTIGNSVSIIEYSAFKGCPKITAIKCLGKTPPILDSGEKSEYEYSVFDECVYQNATLYVPINAVDAYRNAEGWKLFQHIVGFYDYDFETDGVFYQITDDGKVVVARDKEAYQGVVSIPAYVTYEGVTYEVTGIGSGAFADATLQSLILPVTIGTIEDGAFDGCHINSLIITGDGNWTAGAIAGEIDNLYVMSTVTGIEGLQVNPTTIYSYSTVPPTCDEQTFTGYDGALHVPASSLAAYFTAPYWSNFINITGDAVEPTGVTLNKDSVEVLAGNQLTLTATPAPANATPNNCFWTSSDESIATVTDGLITAVKAGECDIKVYLLDKVAVCHVTVTEILPTEVTLSPDYAKLEIGSQITLTATISPEDATDKLVTWSTTNTDVATVDSLGTVTAVGQGECFITATCRDKQAMCHIIVVDHFIYITLDEHEVRLLPNHMVTLTPSVSPANTTLVVTSSDPTVAAARMANGNIQLVGIKEGTTVITVNSTDGYAEADSCLVKVYTLRGDVNSDGFINISDVTVLINRLFSGPAPTISEENADANNDGKITIADVTALINSLLSGEPLPPKDEPIEDNLTFTVNGVTFTMVAVEGGTFTMGATPEQGDDALDGEKPAHQVTLSDYAIGETEVTQALWVAVMGTNPSRFKDRPENPVELVDWNDCQAFITQLNQLTGRQFRLPTEAEWEYAARGGNKSQGYKYAGSNNVDEVAWYSDNCSSTQPVGTKKANELGIYDMSGNVWEWCQDYYGSYTSAAQTNPTGPATGTDRIRRGVGWNGSSSSGRVSHRSSREQTYKYNSQGLRLAL